MDAGAYRRATGIETARIPHPYPHSCSMPTSAEPSSDSSQIDPDTVVQDTIRWLERAVIGLNLCPFAKGVHTKGRIHYVVSPAKEGRQLLQDLKRELESLAEISPEKRDTTLLMAPGCFEDFLDFNDFLKKVDGLIDALDFGGVLQVASFHPQFQFGGTDADDVTNCTNRAPYPTLHLLREDSIEQAVQAFPEAEMIYERNMQVLQEMGAEGWRALDVGARCPVAHAESPPKGNT